MGEKANVGERPERDTPFIDGSLLWSDEMSSKRGIVAVALAALMVLSVVGPALAAAQIQEDDTTDDGGDLTVDVREGGNDTVLVVVEDENGSVEGATVTVSAEETEDADDNETDDNETSDDDETSDDNETVDDNETSDDVEDNETSDDNETVDGNETSDDDETEYEGTGTYTTDANGTVELPAPDDGVRLNVEVEDGNRTTSANVTLDEGATVPFGERVSGLIQQILQDDGNTSVGQTVAEFVRGNNPGNASESAGPPEDRGNGSDAEQGPPEDRGNGSDAGQGPPEDRGNGSDAEQGPPEDRGNGSDAEQGSNDDRGGNGSDAGQGPPEDRGGDRETADA